MLPLIVLKVRDLTLRIWCGFSGFYETCTMWEKICGFWRLWWKWTSILFVQFSLGKKQYWERAPWTSVGMVTTLPKSYLWPLEYLMVYSLTGRSLSVTLVRANNWPCQGSSAIPNVDGSVSEVLFSGSFGHRKFRSFFSRTQTSPVEWYDLHFHVSNLEVDQWPCFFVNLDGCDDSGHPQYIYHNML